MAKLRSLWSGDLALDDAFWTWAVMVGLLINIGTSTLFLVLILQDRPLAAVFAGYALSIPYNIVATVGVWRSAARDRHFDGGTDAHLRDAHAGATG